MTYAYFIAGDAYARWTIGGGVVDVGYPKPIAQGWSNIGGTGFDGGVDAAVDLGTGKLYFFLGAAYARIDNASNTVEAAGMPIAGNWPGMAENGFGDALDAAVNNGDGSVCFFRGDQCLLYDIGADSVSTGPAPIAERWPGLVGTGFDEGLDTAVDWGDGTVYFFRGDSYLAYDRSSGQTGGVLSVASDWDRFGALGFVPPSASWVRLTATTPAVGPTSEGKAGVGDCIWYYDHRVHVGSSIPRMTWFPDADPAIDTDYRMHGKEIYEYVVHADGVFLCGQPHLKAGRGSFAWLNRNPGNIMLSRADYGQYPGKTNWHGFMIFPTEELGFAAIGRLLRGPGYAHKSLLQVFEAYAPAKDGNDPVKYASDVAAAVGVSSSTTIDALDDQQLLGVQEKIRGIEGTVEGDTLGVGDLPPEVQAVLS
ncbi:MAG: hypothetical protein JST25_03075 [Actinobacteria bacterium]|nr:hypothetical protein [Actinomycetota bacterium]